MLDLDGCLVSIDAMGCQQTIANQIVERKADYLLAVKQNQKGLCHATQETFRFQGPSEREMSCELDFGHGRIENRREIENKLHWMLDVAMGDDASRKRARNSPQNFSVVFKTAMAMLKSYNPCPEVKKGPSIKTKRKMGGWSDEHLSAMLNVAG